MSALTIEHIDTAPDATDGDGPDIAHCYCAVCSRGREVAVSICGAGRKPTAELGMEWPAGHQRCAVCVDLELVACRGCGS